MRITGLFTGILLLIMLSLSFLLPSFSYAQAGQYLHVAPQKPKPVPFSPKITVKSRKSAMSKKVAIPILKGIVFVSSVKNFKPHGVSRNILGENGSIIVTSNRSFSEWDKIFTDSVLATAVLDRLLHHSTVINIRGKSYRLREKQKNGIIGAKVLMGQ